ncbi:MAG: hypothetical protein ACX936_17825 [Marinobacter sp.]
MNPLMHWISEPSVLTMIILAIIVFLVWRYRFIAVGGVVLALAIGHYAQLFSGMEKRASETESAYVSCLHRELCATGSARCPVCNGLPDSDREKCLRAQINMEGLDTSNRILATCLASHEKSYIRDALDNIWNAIKPF